jgi:hypothetical protein
MVGTTYSALSRESLGHTARLSLDKASNYINALAVSVLRLFEPAVPNILVNFFVHWVFSSVIQFFILYLTHRPVYILS